MTQGELILDQQYHAFAMNGEKEMDSAKLNDGLQILGMIGIMASLIFVGLQLKQTDNIASIDGQDSAVQRHFDMLSLMAEHADVWQRGCMGEELSVAEDVLFAKIFTVYVNNSFAGWRRLELSDYRDSSSAFNINAYAANVHRYPGFANANSSLVAWDELGGENLGPVYETYQQRISARVNELERIEPDPDYDAKWCGRT